MEDERLEAGMDLDAEETPQYLRRQRRVDVRRGGMNRKTLERLKLPGLVALCFAVAAVLTWQVALYGLHAQRFLLRPENVDVQGSRYVTRAQVLERFSTDLNESVFSVSLSERRAQIEQIPWVERANVARLWPDRIRVVIVERVPVAFVRTASGVSLVDASGQILDRPSQAEFSFPVVSGVAGAVAPEDRRRRMALFGLVLQQLDSEGTRYSQDLSEVDVSDPEDARVLVTDTAILLHLGNERFLERYKTYLGHIQEWQRTFPKIRSVDLRYERQVVVNPDTR